MFSCVPQIVDAVRATFKCYNVDALAKHRKYFHCAVSEFRAFTGGWSTTHLLSVGPQKPPVFFTDFACLLKGARSFLFKTTEVALDIRDICLEVPSN